MTQIGIISDTHLKSITESFRKKCAEAFSGCDAVIHAGDLTDISILSSFGGKEIYGVHGNMCNLATRQILPEARVIYLHGYSIGICHGAGPRHNIEERLLTLFPETDCIVYGHTHIPVCHRTGSTLFINPGSFQGNGRYDDSGTYGILLIEKNSIKGSIHQIAGNI
jgi:putative phosphoesterase